LVAQSGVSCRFSTPGSCPTSRLKARCGFGHVNHDPFLVYFDAARNRYLEGARQDDEMSDRPPITGTTTVLAIFGRPIGHALSPLIHNAALAAAGRDAVFVPFSPTPETLEVALRGVVAAGCAGLCITIPFKPQVVPLLDTLAPSAATTGAVNTVVVEDGRTVGHNTDVDGVLRCIASLPVRARTRAVVLGAGGAGRAAAVALARAGFERLTIANRTRARGEALAADLAGTLTVAATGADAASLAAALEGAELLVNTSPVGMYPDDDSTPVPARLLRPGLDVVDAIYRPEPTRLCREARAAGAGAVSGVDWIIGQGAEAMRLWLGFDPDEAAMRAALADYLARPRRRRRATDPI
jgi:shikimate dehydrogenase